MSKKSFSLMGLLMMCLILAGCTTGTPFQVSVFKKFLVYPEAENVSGLKFNIFSGEGTNLNGVDFGGLDSYEKSINGVAITGGLAAAKDEVNGVAIGGVMAASDRDLNGFALGGVMAGANTRLNGLLLAGSLPLRMRKSTASPLAACFPEGIKQRSTASACLQ
jgi:hypothetical protein